MKRLMILLFMMLFLAACGSGGGGGATATADKGLAMGTLNVDVRDATAKVAALAPSFPQRVRIVVSNDTLLIAGKSYHVVRDEPIGNTTPITFVLPVHTGYKIEALYYAFDSNNANVKVLQKYASSGATVTSSGVTDVRLDMNYFTVPRVTSSVAEVQAHVPGGPAAQTYTLTADFGTDPTPLQEGWAVRVSTTEPSAPMYNGYPSKFHTLTAPDSFTDRTLYYQPLFFIKSSLLDPENNESVSNWTFVATYDDDDDLDDAREYYALKLALKVNGVPFNPDSGLFNDTVTPTVTNLSVPTAVQISNSVSPIKITALDDAGATHYKIRQTVVAATEAVCKANGDDPTATFTTSDWDPLTSAGLTYPVVGTINDGVANYVRLSVKVKDASGKESAWSGWKTVVINNKPVIQTFTTPTRVLLPVDNSPVDITITKLAATGTSLQYALSTSPDTAPTDGWSTPSATLASYPTVGLKHTEDNTVKIYIWAKNGTVVSAPVSTTVHINDLPVVTAFTVPTALQNSRLVSGIVLTGESVNRPSATLQFAITEGGALPVAADWQAGPITSYTVKSTSNIIKSPNSGYLALQAWVSDGTAVSQSVMQSILVSVP